MNQIPELRFFYNAIDFLTKKIYVHLYSTPKKLSHLVSVVSFSFFKSFISKIFKKIGQVASFIDLNILQQRPLT